METRLKIKKKLMQNFNIRYECHDAKDDYREQRNKSTEDSETDFLQRMFGTFVDEDGNVDNDDGDYVVDVNHEGSEELYDITGELSIKKATQASNMISVLQNARWYDDVKDDLKTLNQVESVNIPPLPYKTVTEWSKIVQQKQKEIIADRMKRLPKIVNVNSHIHDNPNGDVKVISFLNKTQTYPPLTGK